MKYRKLNSLQYSISELSLGTYPFKGWWGKPLPDSEVMKIIYKAIELGINYIDTADVYGLGESESLIGKISSELKGKFIISTKGGRDFTTKIGEINKNFDTRYLQNAFNNSLKRLQRNFIDIYFLHGPENIDYERKEIFDFLEELKHKGKVMATGISLNKPDELELLLKHYKPDVVSIAYNYLSNLNITEFCKKLKESQIDLIVREPLAQGLLSGKYNQESQFPSDDHRSWKWTKDFWDKNEKKLNEFNKENNTYEDKIKASFSHILNEPYIRSVIFGVKSVEQLHENLKFVYQ